MRERDAARRIETGEPRECATHLACSFFFVLEADSTASLSRVDVVHRVNPGIFLEIFA